MSDKKDNEKRRKLKRGYLEERDIVRRRLTFLGRILRIITFIIGLGVGAIITFYFILIITLLMV